MDKLGVSRQEAGEWVGRLCRAVREAVGADRVIVWLYDAPRQAVIPYAADSPGAIDDVVAEWPEIPLDELPAAVSVLLEARPVEIADAQADDRIPPDLAAELAMGSVRFEPLLAGRAVGMLTIEPAVRGASPELHTLLPLVAAAVSRVSGAIESDRQRAEAEFLLGLTEAALAAGSMEEMLTMLCQRVAAMAGARRATVFLLQEGRLQVAASRYADGSRDLTEWELMRRAPAVLPATEAALHSGEPVVTDSSQSPLVAGWWADTLGIESLIAVAIGSPPRAVGVLIVDDSQPESLSPEDVRLVAAAAAHIAPTIEQARMSAERTSHLRAATAIRRLFEEGSRAVSVEEAGEALARVTQEAIEAEQATVLMRDEHDRIRHLKTVGANGDLERTLRSHAGGLAAEEFRLWRIAARDAKPIFIENAAASRLLPPELVEALGLKSYVAFPLLAEERALGLVLCSHTTAPRRWTDEERQLVAQLALEGSLVVENAALRATEQQRLDELSHQAFHDSLTELPNRALFADRLGLALARTNRRKAAVAVLFLDLDDFKPINDRFGHDAGDRLLKSVAERVRACVRPEDTVARLGGDEFTVLLEDIVDVRYAIGVAERIEDALREPFPIDGHEATVTASIGIAVSSGREATPADLMRNSDQAMYQAKRRGRARHVLFAVTTVTEDESTTGVSEGEAGQPQEPAAAAPRATWPRVEEQLAVEEELAGEAAIEDATAVEHAEAAPFDGGDAEPEAAVAPPATEAVEREQAPPQEPEKPDAPRQADEDIPVTDETLGSAAALTEARRRRRRRFPPRG
ncbi:MAG: diguanylate cyclase domain-containing protein [Solirubrobacterales bacterium]